MKRTIKQKLGDILRRKKYMGCHGQTSDHGCDHQSIQVFATDTPENRVRFPGSPVVTSGSLTVLDFDVS